MVNCRSSFAFTAWFAVFGLPKPKRAASRGAALTWQTVQIAGPVPTIAWRLKNCGR